MNFLELSSLIFEKNSYLCVGLDSDLSRIPPHLLKEPDPLFAFNKAIIDATADYCIAYKINTAFYEAQGAAGWESMAKTLEYIPPNIFTIADAKRGDIGNTVTQYAQAFFKTLNFDAITVAPYMGEDSVKPFLQYGDKWVILLALTSNQSSRDFQLLTLENDLSPEMNVSDLGIPEEETLFERVIKTSQQWASKSRLMYVVGATQAAMLKRIRTLAPRHFLLIPGVGTQGGSLEEVSQNGLSEEGGLLVNVSRKIIYASSGTDFAQAAQAEAQHLQTAMAKYLDTFLSKI